MCVVLPITSKNHNTLSCINIGKIEKLKNVESFALLNQIRAISRARLIRPRNKKGKMIYIKLNAEKLNLIDKSLKEFLLK